MRRRHTRFRIGLLAEVRVEVLLSASTSEQNVTHENVLFDICVEWKGNFRESFQLRSCWRIFIVHTAMVPNAVLTYAISICLCLLVR